MRLGASFLTLLVLCSFMAACSRRELPETSWSQLIQDIYNPESIADIGAPCTEIYTSYDRTGGNNDFNNGFKKRDDGWLELADLKGPGVMTRFWFTGIEERSVFRFVFDDEETPRLEKTCRGFYKEKGGFPSGFVSTDQNCFYSGFPVPYGKRLRILVSDEGYSRGQGKLFFQINAVKLKNKTVSSAKFPVPEEVVTVADTVSNDLKTPGRPAGPIADEHFAIQPGASQTVMTFDSGGMIRWLRLEIDGWAEMAFQRRMDVLRQAWISIEWDGSGKDSVRVPLGDFFGQMWEPKKLSNLYFSVDETGFECRLPMPFRASARISLTNPGQTSISGRVSVVKDDGPVPDACGYFHSGWQRSSENSKGYPHEVLSATGRGRLVGCLLGVASFDRSFWALESDETIRRDGNEKIFWQGTGLEDYFNSGWYYRTVFQEPLFGLTLKRPFRTVQYRFHLQDPVTFDKKLDMSFERGPANASRAAYDSIVYYYLDTPTEAFGSRILQISANPPPDEFEARSLMTRLWDYENLDDFLNAEKLTQYALTYWNYPPDIKALLELRLLEYQARRSGYGDVREMFHKVQAAGGSAGVEAAKLIEFHEKGAALIFGYSNRKTTVFLDGRVVLTAGDPVRRTVAAIPVAPGRHSISLATEVGGWPDWVQAGLMKGGCAVGTDFSWTGAATDSTFRDPGAAVISTVVLSKGPPEMEAVPFVFPDPYVGLQSGVDGLRYNAVQNGGGASVFRKEFEVH